MKILFVNLHPSTPLLNELATSHHETKSLKTLPKKEEADVVFFHWKKAADNDALKQFKKGNRGSWLVIAASEETLNDPGLYQHLLKCDAKDDIVPAETWEAFFWFTLQKKENASRETQDLSALQREHEELLKTFSKIIVQLEKNVELATHIQRALLPTVSPEIPGVSIAVKYLPAAGHGGDYYDMFEFGDKKRYGVLLADSQTHGMAAALLSVLLKVRLDEMKERFPSSKTFLEHINRELCRVSPIEKAGLSVLYAMFDRHSLELEYTSGGHLTPLLWRNGKFHPQPALGNPLLGQLAQYDFRTHTLKLQPGDLLIFHTDGLTEPLHAATYSEVPAQLSSLLKEMDPSVDPLSVQNELLSRVHAYTENHPLKDDLTLIHFAVDERVLYLAKTKPQST